MESISDLFQRKQSISVIDVIEQVLLNWTSYNGESAPAIIEMSCTGLIIIWSPFCRVPIIISSANSMARNFVWLPQVYFSFSKHIYCLAMTSYVL